MNFSDLTSDRELLEHATVFASFIDAKAGGYPLVNGLPEEVGKGLLWQYGNHDFLLYYGSVERRFPRAEQLGKSSPSESYLRSLEEALEFIRLTEAIRQKTVYPNIQLGRMPRTSFM